MVKFDNIEFKKARDLILEKITPTSKTLFVDIQNLLGKVTADDIKTIKPLPAYNNSAMDGYGYKVSDSTKELTIKDTIFAGEVKDITLNDNECVKIMTGAFVPDSVEVIAPFEACEVNGNKVKVPNLKKGSNIRLEGEEVQKDEVLIKKGMKLKPSHIALLASQGIMMAKVYKPLDIAVIASGNELKEPWEEASKYDIYNSNSFGIKSFLEKYGFGSDYIGKIPDNLDEIINYIKNLSSYDVIISSGGASKGEADFIKEALLANGYEIIFHGINQKPGKPVLIAKNSHTTFIALPGNPLATMINLFTLTIPILFKMQGKKRYHHDFIYAKMSDELKFKGNRSEIVLGNLSDGVFHPTRKNKYGAGMLTPLVESNSIAIFCEGVSEVKKDEIIKVIPFDLVSSAKSSDNVNSL